MSGSLISKLPTVRGKYTEDAPLASTTWFRVGGPAEVLYKPADLEDLRCFLAEKPADIPVRVIGVGSNLLVRDGGVPGVVIRLGRGFSNIYVNEDVVDVGAGMLDRNVALACRDASLGGLEFLCTIPGTIGGALRMNAGCYGSEMQDIVAAILAIDLRGNLHHLGADQCKFSYRHCGIAEDMIFIGARLKGYASSSAEIGQKMQEMLKARDDTQPVRTRTGGSTFANAGDAKAWELIDKVGCRGMKVGGAQISEKHCNFMINTGGATAHDLESLGEIVRSRVLEATGIDLRWEIQRIGEPSDDLEREAKAA